MGASYGASGSSQGLTRTEAAARNRAVSSINASKNPSATAQKAARQFKEETGKNLSDYVNLPGKRKKK